MPVFVLLLFGMLEFGFAFSHNLTLEYATREGARTGAALGPGTANIPCANVDEQIIAAAQRVLTSPGSPVDVEPDQRDHDLQGQRQRRAGRRRHHEHLDPGRGPDGRRCPPAVQVEHGQLGRLHARQRLEPRLDRDRPRLQLSPDQSTRRVPRDGRDARLPDVRPNRHGAQPELGDATDGSPGPPHPIHAWRAPRASGRRRPPVAGASGRPARCSSCSWSASSCSPGSPRSSSTCRGTGPTRCASSGPPMPPPWRASSGCRARRAPPYTTAMNEATKNGYTDGSAGVTVYSDQGPDQQPSAVGHDHGARQHVLHEDLRDPRR